MALHNGIAVIQCLAQLLKTEIFKTAGCLRLVRVGLSSAGTVGVSACLGQKQQTPDQQNLPESRTTALALSRPGQ